MKKLVTFLFALLICNICVAHTINWHVGNSVYTTTTCESGDNITPPTPPVKKGYTFEGWFAYTPIEYLESTGTQIINTLFIPNGFTSIKIDAQFLNLSNLQWIFGIRNSNTHIFSLGYNPSINRYIFGYAADIGNNSVTTVTPNTQRHIFELNKGACYIDSVTVKNYNTINFTSDRTLFLFGINSNLNAASSSYRIYSCKIYDNDILVRDFIPVLDANGVACMFDKVEKKFYYNAGTGDFIAGPIISE